MPDHDAETDHRVGLSTPEIPFTVDEALNQYYLDATHENQLLFVEGDGSGRVVPMTRLFGPTTRGFPDPAAMMQVSYEKALMAGASYEFHRLPRIGETLTVQGVISDVTRKETNGGAMTLLVLENVYRDAGGQPIGTERLTFVERP